MHTMNHARSRTPNASAKALLVCSRPWGRRAVRQALAAWSTCGALGVAGAAAAASPDATESDFSWNGKAEVSSDSRERGISNSANRPSVRLVAEMLHASGLFAELELTRVSKLQYPGGSGLRVQSAIGYRFGDPVGWQFELGLFDSRFPGSSQSAASGYALEFDPSIGEVVGATLVPKSVSLSTSEIFASVRYGAWSARYFHTVSRDFFAISGHTVCPGIADLVESFACFERGAAHSRGSGYLEVDFTQRLSKSASVVVRLGQQRVRNWRSFDTRSYAVEFRQAWRSLELSVAVTGASARQRGVYDLALSNGSLRDPTKATAVLALAYVF
jgi:hypothetical protein